MEELETLALTESETARRLGVSISGLRRWRQRRTGPRFIRLGRLIRYLSSDIKAWLAAHAVDPDNNSEE